MRFFDSSPLSEGRMSIAGHNADRTILRALAAEVAELAARPVEQQKRVL